MKEIYKISKALTNENIKNIMDELPPVYFDTLGKKAIGKTKFLTARKRA